MLSSQSKIYYVHNTVHISKLVDGASERDQSQTEQVEWLVDSTRHVELSLVIEFVIVTAGLVIYLA